MSVINKKNSCNQRSKKFSLITTINYNCFPYFHSQILSNISPPLIAPISTSCKLLLPPVRTVPIFSGAAHLRNTVCTEWCLSPREPPPTTAIGLVSPIFFLFHLCSVMPYTMVPYFPIFPILTFCSLSF